MSEYIITCDDEVALWVGNDVESMRPLVRCRDCKEFTFGDVECATVDWCDYWGTYVESPDGFCAWGERRERESVEVWNQWSADDVTCSEES